MIHLLFGRSSRLIFKRTIRTTIIPNASGIVDYVRIGSEFKRGENNINLYKNIYTYKGIYIMG